MADHLSDISSDEDDDIFYDAVEASTSGEELLTEDEIDGSDAEDDDDEYFDIIDDWQDGMGANFDPQEYYTLGNPVHQFFPRYGSHGITAHVDFHNMDQLTDAGSVSHGLEAIFNDILRHLLNIVPGGPNDLVGVQVNHPMLDKPIICPFQIRQNVCGEVIARWIERVLQSHEDLDLNELDIQMIIIEQPVGGAYNPLRSNWQEWMTQHSSGHGGFLVLIPNDADNLCLARAIVYARARLCSEDKRYQWNSVRRHDERPTQKRLAMEIMELAGLENHTGFCGLEEARKLQAVLPEFQIKIYSKDFANCMIFRGPDEKDDSHVIHLYHHDNHFTVISSVKGFMARNYYCEFCDKGYNNREDHRCAKVCPCCYSRDPDCLENDSTKIFCQLCNRNFRKQNCFDRHNVKQPVFNRNKRKRVEVSICDRYKCCPDCGVLITEQHKSKDQQHICGYFDCRICDEYVEIKDHLCYIKPIGNRDDEVEELDNDNNGDEERNEKLRYVFFDFEASQEKVLEQKPYGPVLEHKVNLCVAHIVCSDCLDNKDLGHCSSCKQGRRVFSGANCQTSFCEWLFISSDSLKKTKTIAIAHNMKGYDGQFILQYLHSQARVPVIVPKGLEIMSISFGKTKIIDSLNFLPSRLADLPKTFGFQEIKKGYFPHLFNKMENWDYVGPMPDNLEYGPATMKPSDRNQFYQWYNEEVAANRQFDFRKEILEYCESDVDILRKCCLAFRRVFLESTGMDPFSEALTIAAACNRVFRKLFLKKHTIGVVPHGGYRKKDMYSIIAVKWLKWIEESEKINIQHAVNSNEASIGPYKVDGLCNKTVYEFHGCWYHGCPRCMKRRLQLTADQQTMAKDAYKRTVERSKFIKGEGYTLVEQWECDLYRQLKRNKEMADYFDSIKIIAPMDPREAFYGGRTNATKLYHKCRPGEKIKYIDVVSLYPWVCKYGEFPLGHPEVITDNFALIDKDNKPYKGLIKVTMLPPQDMYLPILPVHCNNKLLFPLCLTCAKQQQKEPCQHSDSERAITGTWCHLELYKAVDKGYKVLDVHEVYHYSQWEQYDPQAQTGGFFSDYIDKFLKMKQEADGWPAWCQSDADKDRYIDDYFQHEGIKLDKAKIEKNPGFRALAKLMLNSFWGKFGQRNNQSQIEYFTEPEPFCQTVFDPTNVITAVNFVSDTMVAVTHTQIDDFVQVAGNTNVIIAAFTTAQARLKLYSYLEKLQERVLYFDTDSVVYLSKEGQWEPEIGSYLGMMSNELKDHGPHAYVSEFVSGGPKNYSYKIVNAGENRRGKEYKCKVRGFSLLSFVQNQLNFKSMRRMVKGFVKSGCKEEFTIIYHKISRLPIHHTVVTMPQPKRYRVVYDKRVVNKDFTTLPYGFINSSLDALLDAM